MATKEISIPYSMLVKPKFEKKIALHKLIKDNLGLTANITFRPKNPLTIADTLTEDHLEMVNVGWVSNIVML